MRLEGLSLVELKWSQTRAQQLRYKVFPGRMLSTLTLGLNHFTGRHLLCHWVHSEPHRTESTVHQLHHLPK